MTTNKTIKPATPSVNTNDVPSAALLAMGRLKHVNLASNKTVEQIREGVPAGEYQGQVTVTLDYDITVGESHEAEVAQSVPWKQLAGILFGKLNPATRDKIVREALEASDAGGFQLRDDVVNKEAEQAIAQLMGMTRKTVAGKVTGTTVLTLED